MALAFGLGTVRHVLYFIFPALRPAESSDERPGVTTDRAGSGERGQNP
jgi:hypothetical protein